MEILHEHDYTLYKNDKNYVLILQTTRPIIFQDTDFSNLQREVKDFLLRIKK